MTTVKVTETDAQLTANIIDVKQPVASKTIIKNLDEIETFNEFLEKFPVYGKSDVGKDGNNSAKSNKNITILLNYLNQYVNDTELSDDVTNTTDADADEPLNKKIQTSITDLYKVCTSHGGVYTERSGAPLTPIKTAIKNLSKLLEKYISGEGKADQAESVEAAQAANGSFTLENFNQDSSSSDDPNQVGQKLNSKVDITGSSSTDPESVVTEKVAKVSTSEQPSATAGSTAAQQQTVQAAPTAATSATSQLSTAAQQPQQQPQQPQQPQQLLLPPAEQKPTDAEQALHDKYKQTPPVTNSTYNISLVRKGGDYTNQAKVTDTKNSNETYTSKVDMITDGFGSKKEDKLVLAYSENLFTKIANNLSDWTKSIGDFEIIFTDNITGNDIKGVIFSRKMMRKGDYLYVFQNSNKGIRLLMYIGDRINHESVSLGSDLKLPEIKDEIKIISTRIGTLLKNDEKIKKIAFEFSMQSETLKQKINEIQKQTEYFL